MPPAPPVPKASRRTSSISAPLGGAAHLQVWMPSMDLRAASPGSGNSSSRSKRPGRRSAPSSASM
eukprot:82247-Chlamydomonas_euryale.AAC.1